jgi:hypothetical protein
MLMMVIFMVIVVVMFVFMMRVSVMVMLMIVFPNPFGRFILVEQGQIDHLRITPLLHNLSHDAQGNLIPAPGLNVQTGWRFQGQHIGVGQSLPAQIVAHRLRSFGAGNQADVGRFGFQDLFQGQFVIIAVSGDEDVGKRPNLPSNAIQRI